MSLICSIFSCVVTNAPARFIFLCGMEHRRLRAFDTGINVNNGDFGGWAIVAEGFLLNSPVLAVVGSVIGCSGAILTKIKCDAMNRNMNVAAPVKKSG